MRNKSFENKEESLDKLEFGRWLSYLINWQIDLADIREKYKNEKNKTNESYKDANTMLLNLVQETKLLKIASVLDEFNKDTIARKIK